MFPKLMPVDDWEYVAESMQGELKKNIKEDIPPQYDQKVIDCLQLVEQ